MGFISNIDIIPLSPQQAISPDGVSIVAEKNPSPSIFLIRLYNFKLFLLSILISLFL